MPHFSNVTKTQCPSSVTSHDHFSTQLLPTKHKPQHHFETSHDQNLSQYSNATKTTSNLLPIEPKFQYSSVTCHDQYLPQETQYPSSTSHDQFKQELLANETKP